MPTAPVTLVDHRAGYVEATLTADSDAGDAGDVLATATRYRFGWVVRTSFGHSQSEPIRLKPGALAALRQYADQELAERLGNQPRMETQPMDSNENLADSLRKLASLIDEHPEMADWYRYPSLNEHQTGAAEARNLDAFAAVFGVDIGHRPANDDGVQYSVIETNVGVLGLRLQALTDDYRAAAVKAGDTE